MARDRQSLALLTCKCASRHNGVHFFDISTSKSGPSWSVFNTLDFQICLVSQRRALFERLNFQKRSQADVFLTCWLRHVCALDHSHAHLFYPTSQVPKALRSWCALRILTSKCPWRHSHMHFFNGSTFKSAPNLNCSAHFDSEVSFAPQPRAIFCFLIRPDGSASAALASLLFDPSENTVQLFYLFAHLNLLSSDSFSSLIFLLLPFSCLTCPTSAFPSVHIAGSLTSKFLSTARSPKWHQQAMFDSRDVL